MSSNTKPKEPALRPEADALTLRLLSGIHAGAERALEDGETVVIGCGDDCDVILSDADVAVHHCLVGVRGGHMTLRAMDARVKIGTRVLPPGDPLPLPPFAVVTLGAATFAAGAHWSERWRELAVVSGGAPVKPNTASRNGLRWAALLLGIGMLAMGLAWYLANRPRHALSINAERAQVAAVLRTLNLHRIQIQAGQNGHLQLFGIVQTPAQADGLRTALSARGMDDVELQVRDGVSVATDLREQLRMAAPPVDAQTAWQNNGTVLVTGHFGDGDALTRALRSSSMQDFNSKLGLKVAIQNLDQLQPGFVTPSPGKRITSIFEGDDPYLVTADNSRYYTGSTLPQGGVFTGLDGDQILVRDQAGNIRRYDLAKVAPGASRVNPNQEVQNERQ